MKNRISRFALRSMMLATLSSISIGAQAEDSFKDWSFSGFFDLYYAYDFGRPATGNNLNYRQFDTFHNGFELASVNFNAVRAATAKNPWGITLNLAAGHNVDIINAGEPAGSDSGLKYLQQAYVSYVDPQGKFTVDLGKFLTWIGYEGVISADNDLYSRSFLFYCAQPIYHVGLRASAPAGPLTAGVYLVNGWNEAEDSNGAKSYGASLSGTFGQTSAALNYYGGVEGASTMNGFFAAPATQTAVHMGDLVVTRRIGSQLKLGLNADYASAAAVNSGDLSGHFYGIAGYAKVDVAPNTAVGLRYESVCDPDGLRTGFSSTLNSISGSVDFTVAKAGLIRLELRHDTSNRRIFNADNGPKDHRTTATVAFAMRF